jgi:hypothetical protein
MVRMISRSLVGLGRYPCAWLLFILLIDGANNTMGN